MRHVVALFEADGDASLDSADDLGEALGKLGLLLLIDIALVVLFVGDKDLLDGGIICDGVQVEDALVALGEDGLVTDQLEDVELGLEKLSHWHCLLVAKAQNITLVHFLLIVNAQSEFHILTRLCVFDRLVLAVVNSDNLASKARGHQSQGISELNSA